MITSKIYSNNLTKLCPICYNKLNNSEKFTVCFSQCSHCSFYMSFDESVQSLHLNPKNNIHISINHEILIYKQNFANISIIYHNKNIKLDIKYIKNPASLIRYLTLLE